MVHREPVNMHIFIQITSDPKRRISNWLRENMLYQKIANMKKLQKIDMAHTAGTWVPHWKKCLHTKTIPVQIQTKFIWRYAKFQYFLWQLPYCHEHESICCEVLLFFSLFLQLILTKKPFLFEKPCYLLLKSLESWQSKWWDLLQKPRMKFINICACHWFLS